MDVDFDYKGKLFKLNKYLECKIRSDDFKSKNQVMDKMLKSEMLADTFISVIQEWLTDEKMSELREKNNSLKDSSICASHDYCDANQAMIDALEKHGVTMDIQDERQIKLTNQAWDIAKKNDFMTRIQLLEDLGFPMLADWISEDEITSLKEGLDHLEENKYMMDDEEDRKAFKQAEEILRSMFNGKN